MAQEQEEKIFEPKSRVLLDILLFVNLGFFVLFAVAGIKLKVLLTAGAAINLIMIVLWRFAIRPAVTIHIENNTVTGPSRFLRKKTIPFRKVDHKKTAEPPASAFKKWFCKDIWSTEGAYVRLYRKFLGEEKIYKIMSAIYKYPFRDSSASAKEKPETLE